jgi:hypothetical protein
MTKITIDHDAVRRLGEEVAQKIQNDPALWARILAHVDCDAPGCPQRQELPERILVRSSGTWQKLSRRSDGASMDAVLSALHTQSIWRTSDAQDTSDATVGDSPDRWW